MTKTKERMSKNKLLMIMATSTPEKIVHFQTIVRENGVNAVVIGLNDLVAAFHSAPEDTGDSVGNATQKINETKGIIEQCVQKNSRQRTILKQVGVSVGAFASLEDYSDEHVIVVTEDSSMHMQRPVWKVFRRKLTPFISEELLNSAEGKDGKGPGAETGPIMEAVGKALYYKLLSEAMRDVIAKNLFIEKATAHLPQDLCDRMRHNFEQNGILGDMIPVKNNMDGNVYEQLWKEVQKVAVSQKDHDLTIIEDRCACMCVRLSDPQFVREKKFNTQTNLRIFAPYGLGEPVPMIDEHPLPITAHFMATLDQRQLELQWGHYLSTHSPRSKMVRAIIDYYGAGLDTPQKLVLLKNGSKTKVFRLVDMVQVSHHTLSANQFLPVPERGKCEKGSHISKACLEAYKILSLENTLSRSDAYLFAPFAVEDLVKRRAVYYDLFSLIVAKQLDARDKKKMIGVLDNGSYNPALKILFDYGRKGMLKDFINYPFYEKGGQIVVPNGVTYTGTSYLDIFKGQDIATLSNAFSDLRGRRANEYNRFFAAENWDFHKTHFSSPRKEKEFCVGYFTSASSSNNSLLRFNYNNASYIAEQGMDLVWGAGDRHGTAMNAVLDGYTDAKGRWLIGISTPVIIQSETKNGRFPAVDQGELCADIGLRMARMMEEADLICVAPGGVGTGGQEALAFMRLQDEKARLVEGKEMVFCDIDLYRNGKGFWEATLKAFLGKETYRKMRKDHSYLGDQGIFLSTSEAETQELMAERRDSWSRKKSKIAAYTRH